MLFFNLTNTFHILFLCVCFSSILFAKLFRSRCCKAISERHKVHSHEEDVGLECTDTEDWESAGDGLQCKLFEEDLGFITFDCSKIGDLVIDTICGEKVGSYLPVQSPVKEQALVQKDCEEPPKDIVEKCSNSLQSYSPIRDYTKEKIADEVTCSVAELEDQNKIRLTMPLVDRNEKDSLDNIDSCGEGRRRDKEGNHLNAVKNFLEDGDFFIFSPPKFESKNVKPLVNRDEDAFGDLYTVGSTSKSSSECRTSLQYRDSVSDYHFSSSSRRSCPAWESSTPFRKYDEEMMFYDQISAQKLNETKPLKGVELFPRSMSQRLVHRLTKRNKKSSEFQRSAYHELETAYVAQICLAWEALSLTYRNFLQLRALQGEDDPGCPASTAQQFQQFQVLLQRFIENEPYERGRRPEAFARIRISSPKLLQVPQFRGIEETECDKKEESWNATVASVKFIRIMEDGIRTFMDFLKADREKHCQFIKAFIGMRSKTTLVDLTLVHMLKKANKKKKKKIKDMSPVGKCFRKTLPKDEEIEILMGLIDLKVVSRVLRMSAISEEQVQWCEEKMSRVRFWEGKLQRHPSPLFFPAHHPRII